MRGDAGSAPRQVARRGARLHQAVAVHDKMLRGDHGQQRAHDRQLHRVAAGLPAPARQHHHLRHRKLV